MDDPMTRSRLDRVTGTRPIGAPDPKLGPLLFLCRFWYRRRPCRLFCSLRVTKILQSTYQVWVWIFGRVSLLGSKGGFADSGSNDVVRLIVRAANSEPAETPAVRIGATSLRLVGLGVVRGCGRGVVHLPLLLPLGARHRNQNAGDSFLRPAGNAAGRTYSRIRPANGVGRCSMGIVVRR